MWEFLFKIGITIAIVAPAAGALHWIWTRQIDPTATVGRIFRGAAEPDWVATRDPMKLYQDGVSVAEVAGGISEEGTRIVFRQLANAASLDTSKLVEWRRLRLRVLRIGSIVGQSVTVGPGGSQVLNNVRGDVDCQIVD
jgi:hypothetical protein